MRKPKLRGYGFRPSQTYSLKQIADKLGKAETTVREWINDGKLPAMTNGNPHLVLGCDITTYFAEQRLKAPRLSIDEFRCMRCRNARKALGGMADFSAKTDQVGTLTALCELCGGSMSKGVALRDLPRLRAIFDIKD